MNKLFLYLVIIGVLTLIVISLWEVYQVSSGAKSPGEVTVSEITNPILMPKPLEEHLKSDSEYSKFLVDSSSADNTSDESQQ